MITRIAGLIGVALWSLALSAGAQPVTLTNELAITALQVEDDADDHFLLDSNLGICRLSPDGKSLLMVETQNRDATQTPATLIIVRLDALESGKRTDFRLDLKGLTTGDAHYAVAVSVFSPDGKHLLFPRSTAATGPMNSEVVHVDLETGRTRQTKFRADLRAADVDHSSQYLLCGDGAALSLTTGRTRRFKYQGAVVSANPAAPIACISTATAGRPQPYHVKVWDLRNDRLLHVLPLPTDRSVTYALPRWTSDGTYAYFQDVLIDGGGEKQVVTRIWNVKTAQLTGAALPPSHRRAPGPRPGTMIMVRGSDDAAHWIIHDAESGAIGTIPINVDWTRDARGQKVAFIKRLHGKPHLCVSTITWERTR